MGEFGLIERLSRIIGSPSKSVVLGIGDDAAVVQSPNSKAQIPNKFQISKSKFKTKEKLLLITTDTLVENVHFKLHGIPRELKALGEKALAVNISDIAAMGGLPTFAVVTIGAPQNYSVKALEHLYQGMLSLCKEYNIQIVGGDTVASPRALLISLTLLGEVEKECLLTRSGAKVGDAIAVTGSFGGNAAAKFDFRRYKIKPCLKAARALAKTGWVTSLIDSSDGLVRSVLEICKASKVGARIWQAEVPRSPRANLTQALYGGEEYELVFTVPGKKVDQLKSEAGKLTGCHIQIIGEVVPRSMGLRLVNRQGKRIIPRQAGYEHFR
jgi:thiamine-monophosphate kinase